MNRRSFFRLLAVGAAAAVVDPEQLLWTPGQTTHFLPPPTGWQGSYSPFAEADIAAAAQALADRIDADALRLYEQAAFDQRYFAGEQWTPADRAAHRLQVITTPYGHQPSWIRGAFLREPYEVVIDVGPSVSTRAEAALAALALVVHPTSEADRAHAGVLQRLVDAVMERPAVRAALDEDIRERVLYGGRRAGRSGLVARIRAAMGDTT